MVGMGYSMFQAPRKVSEMADSDALFLGSNYVIFLSLPPKKDTSGKSAASGEELNRGLTKHT